MRRAHLPGAKHHRLPTPAGCAAMLAAHAALYGDGDPLSPADAMALREQVRLDDEARQRRQGELRLAMRGRG